MQGTEEGAGGSLCLSAGPGDQVVGINNTRALPAGQGGGYCTGEPCVTGRHVGWIPFGKLAHHLAGEELH